MVKAIVDLIKTLISLRLKLIKAIVYFLKALIDLGFKLVKAIVYLIESLINFLELLEGFGAEILEIPIQSVNISLNNPNDRYLFFLVSHPAFPLPNFASDRYFHGRQAYQIRIKSKRNLKLGYNFNI